MRGTILVLSFCIILSLCGLDNNESMVFSFDTLFPETPFHNVEKICKELWTDLDVLTTNIQLHDDWIFESDYLLQQFLILHTKIDNFANDFDSRMYLTEDLEYICSIFSYIEQRFELLKTQIKRSSDTILFIEMLVEKSKKKVEELLQKNREIKLPLF